MMAPADDEPERLIGPLLRMFTTLAGHGEGALHDALDDQLLALACHAGVAPELRLAAGGIVLERCRPCRR